MIETGVRFEVKGPATRPQFDAAIEFAQRFLVAGAQMVVTAPDGVTMTFTKCEPPT